MILTTWTKLILFISFIIVLTVASIPNDSKLGIIYFKSYNYEKALTYFEKSKISDSESPEILRKLKEYFLIQGDVEKALISQRKITELLPKNLLQLTELAKLYNWNNMPYQNLKAREKIVLLQPKSMRTKSYLAIAQGYRWLRKYEDADRINEILAKSNDPTYLEHNLNYYLSTRNVKKVIETIEQLEKFAPNNLVYKKYLAQAYILEGKHEQAIQNYMIAIGNNKEFKNLLYTNKFLEINKKKIIQNMDLINQVIYLYYDIKREDVVADINSLLFDKFPHLYDRGLDAASIYINIKKPEKALRLIKKVYRLNSSKRLHRAAVLLTQLDNFNLAISFNEKAVRLKPANTVYLEDLSNLYEITNQKKKALEIQYRILKLHQKKKKKLINYFYISRNEILVAQADGKVMLVEDKTQKTKLKIITLLEELNNQEDLKVFLENYITEYPMDLVNQKRLAFIYLDLNNKSAAKKIFQDLHKINPMDIESAIYIIDDHIDAKRFKQANQIISPFKNSKDIEILNRSEVIHTELGNKKESRLICDEFIASNPPLESYSHVELLSRCQAKNNNHNQSIEALIHFIEKNPEHEPAHVNLCYNYLHMQNIKQARPILRKIKKMPNQRKTYRDLRKYFFEVKNQLKLSRSWEHSLTLDYFKTDVNHYWSAVTTLVRNLSKYSLGARLHRAKPSGDGKPLGSNALSFIYNATNDLTINSYLGVNFGQSKEKVYGLQFNYLFTENLFVQLDGNFNQQIFEIPVFADAAEATQNDISIYTEYTYRLKNKFIFFGQKRTYSVDKSSADQQNISLQYSRYINKNLSTGIYLFESELLAADEDLKSALLEKSSIRSLHLSYDKRFSSRKWLNNTTIFVGADSARDIDFGEYISFINKTTFTHSRRKEAFISFQWNKESLNVDENESLRINLGYNFWFL